MNTDARQGIGRTALYMRISQDRQGAGLGVQRQEEDCRALVERLGGTVGEVLVDNDLSAYSGKPRPNYLRLMELIEAGAVDAVVVWHTDRLHRSPAELESYIAATEKHGIATHSVQAGQIDLATASGRVHARMLGTFARYESEIKAERIRRSALQKARKGEWLGGAVPLGWHKRKDGVVTLDRPAARRIRAATEEVVAGASLGSIVKRWNGEGFTTARGGTWTFTSVRQVLRRARNAGLVEYHDEIVAESPWPSIVDEATWRKARALLNDPARRRSTSNRVKHLVAGIAQCGKCGSAMKSATANGQIYYRCPESGGGHAYRRAAGVDEQVRETLAQWLASDATLARLLAAGDESEQQDLAAEQVTLRGRLTEVAESFAEGLVSKVQLEAATKSINDRLDAIEAEQAGTRRSAVLGALVREADPAAAFRAAPIDRQRAIIRELVTVTIQPVPKGSPRRYLPELTVIEPR